MGGKTYPAIRLSVYACFVCLKASASFQVFGLAYLTFREPEDL
jgi:hypothetical protein